MFPRLPSANLVDVLAHDAITYRESFGGIVRGPNGPNGVVRKFATLHPRPKRAVPATLGEAIPDIIDLGSKKQVCRITAWWIVAAMADNYTGRNGAVGYFPSNSVGFAEAPSESSDSIAAVAVSGQAGSPQPALFRRTDSHFGPERRDSLLSGKLWTSHVAPPCGVVRGGWESQAPSRPD